MKRLVLSLMVLSLLGLGGQSFAELCTIDAVPAATLLLPYFEVDLADTSGVTTLFSINNASAEATLAHAILWTDWSAPTIDFDMFLTGYDVITVNMRDVFNGTLPITASAGQDGADTISPHGGVWSDNPHWDADFGGLCDAIFPLPDPAITGGAFDRLVNGHTGNPVGVLGGACLGYNHGDDIARGYITIDNVSECSLEFTTSPDYFIDGGFGIANNVNQLWGDYFLIDVANAFAQGDTLVHIEANDLFDAVVIPVEDPHWVPPSNTSIPLALAANRTGYTFYGRYNQNSALDLPGEDNREPLGTTWGSRYLNGGAFTGGTELVVWRDSTANNFGPFTCGVGPNWFPLNETEVIAFDEAEDAVEICFFTGGIISPPDEDDPACFPWETHRYKFGDAPLDVPFDFGWTFLNLNLPPDGPTGDADFGTDGNIAQSYVTAIHSASGLFSVGLQAVQMTDACQDINLSIADGPSNFIPQF